jgi:hypothetical protein
MHREFGVEARVRRGLVASLAGLVMAIMLLATTGTARATCYSSTPNGPATFTDALGDVVNAPDIGNTTVALNAGCGISINPAVTGLNSNDKAVFIYIDTDGNAGTGDPFFGAEVVVGVLGDPTTPGPPVLARWNGATFDFASGQALSPLGTAGFITDLNQLGVAGPTTLALIIEGGYFPPSPASPEFDFAPEIDAFYFPTSFSTSPPPPPPPPPAPPAPPKAPATVLKKAGCTVPKIKGKSVAKAKKALTRAGCKYKIKGKGKVVSTNPKAGTQTSEIVHVKAKKKRKRHSVRALRRFEALDGALRAARGR